MGSTSKRPKLNSLPTNGNKRSASELARSTIESTLIKAINDADALTLKSLLTSSPSKRTTLSRTQPTLHDISHMGSRLTWNTFSLSKYGDNALHYTSRLDKPSLIRLLVHTALFDINARNLEGDTALSIACDCGLTEVVRVLLECGADANTENARSKTPLILATELISPYDIQIVQMLVRSGAASVNHRTRGRNANTALLHAAKFGNIEVIKELVNYDADINFRSPDGSTALMRASYYNHVEIVRYLLNHGAVVDEKNGRGETALYTAAFRGHLNVVKILIDYGADVDEPDIDGDTPLNVACYEFRPEIIAHLLMSHADVNMQVKFF